LLRLFVALPLPEALRTRLGGMASGLPGARWSPPDNLHITLVFAGEMDEDQADLLHDQLSQLRLPPLTVTVRGCGAFDSGHRSHTLWAGVALTPELAHLQAKVETAALKAGLSPEKRKYSPHVTLARLDRSTAPERLQNFIAGNNLLKDSFLADSFTLYSSNLSRHGAVYTPEVIYPLDV